MSCTFAKASLLGWSHLGCSVTLIIQDITKLNLARFHYNLHYSSFELHKLTIYATACVLHLMSYAVVESVCSDSQKGDGEIMYELREY